MRRIIFLFPLLLAGCLPFGRREAGAGRPALTLCVENATAGYGNIIARTETVRFDVIPGRTECKELPSLGGSVRLTARTVGGGARGPMEYAATLPSSAPGCWHWRLGNSQSSEIDVMPCDLEAGLSGGPE